MTSITLDFLVQLADQLPFTEVVYQTPPYFVALICRVVFVADQLPFTEVVYQTPPYFVALICRVVFV